MTGHRIIHWLIGALIALAIVALIAVSSVPAQMQQPRSVEDLTVGHYRSWDTTGQSAYVLGVYSFAVYNGLHCPMSRTVGEYQAALAHDRARIADTDPLAKVMVALFLRNGCVVK